MINSRFIWVKSSPVSHPLFIYTFVWTLALWLTSFKITTNIPSINFATCFLVGSNLLIMFMLNLIIFSGNKKNVFKDKIRIDLLDVEILFSLGKKLRNIWLIGTIIEIIVGGGFPLMWVILGIPKDYTQFGIPTFHGLMNGFFFFFCTTFALRGFILNERSQILGTFVYMLWPVMMLGRGILLGGIVQIGSVFLLSRTLNFKTVVSIILTCLIIIFAFGFLGDTRQSANPFEYLVANEYREIISSLPSGVLWVYTYITSPISNLISNIEVVNPTYFPNQTLGALLPSIIRDKFQLSYTDPLELIDSNLNVSTFYSNFLSDYGILGALVMVSIIHFIIIVFFLKVKQGKVSAMIAYSVLYQCMMFSVFVNLFLLQTYIIQIVLSVYCERSINKEKLKILTSPD
jgi:oligosaccharide repeat unit polymerase